MTPLKVQQKSPSIAQMVVYSWPLLSICCCIGTLKIKETVTSGNGNQPRSVSGARQAKNKWEFDSAGVLRNIYGLSFV